MKKPSKAKRKTGQRAKQAQAPSRARRSHASRGDRSRGIAAPASQPRLSAAQRRVPVLADAYSKDERRSVLLLLAPFALMTVAVGASQLLKPMESSLQQIALLEEPQSISHDTIPSELPAPLAQLTKAVAPPLPLSPAPPSAVRVQAPAEAIAARPETPVRLGKCEMPRSTATPVQLAAAASTDPVEFGRKLAIAARAQTLDLVIYREKYETIGFPMGDVPPLYGVCTDVVIRAYRALGIDLQVLVHKAHIGTGDPSIDHRRTQTLRRFFGQQGVSLPVTDFPEDYRPGDVVTYYRPDGRSSQSHIAIVSDAIAPSGRPMIVHNRGWGPQLEDALFADEMTGHYRFAGAPSQQDAGGPQAVPVPERRAQTPSPTEVSFHRASAVQ